MAPRPGDPDFLKHGPYTMWRLAEGLAAWLGFEQARRRTELMSEVYLYLAIRDIMAARDWVVEPQAKLKRPPKVRGGPETFDFCFSKDRALVAKHTKNDECEALNCLLEIKWIQDKPTRPGDVLGDLRKLSTYCTTNDTQKYMMLVGRQPRCAEVLRGMNNQLGEQYQLCILNDQSHGVMGKTAGSPESAVVVAILSEKPWWKSCQRNGRFAQK